MKLQRKMQLRIIVPVIFAMVIFIFIFGQISQQLVRANEQHAAVEEVIKGIFEVNFITNNYLLFHEKRAEEQWRLRHASLEQQLNNIQVNGSNEQEILETIYRIHTEISSLFNQLVTNYETSWSSGVEKEKSLELERRLIGLLSIKIQAMNSAASRLAAISRSNSNASYQTGNLSLALMALVILILVAVVISITSKNFVKQIKTLNKGAEIIASGNLDYKVKIDNNDEIGDLARSFNTMTDKLRKTEKKLKDHLANLEEVVEQRTKKLSDVQEKLIRSEKLAVLGQLSGGVSHELRNPLGVISNAIYFLKTIIPNANETVNEYLEIISSEVYVAEKIVSDLLDFSRTKPLEIERTDVADMIAQTLKKHPTPENIQVIQKLAQDLQPVYVDPQQIHQVLANLVTNAYDAMPEGGKLTINAQVKKSQVYLDITDTGSGISKKNMDNLFEPLFTTKARGIGLGLAVSKNLTESNGGSIKVKSKEGQGSTFTVILPTEEVVS